MSPQKRKILFVIICIKILKYLINNVNLSNCLIHDVFGNYTQFPITKQIRPELV